MNTEDIYNRPALKEINSNETTSGALSANNNQNKLTTKSPHNNKPQQQDFKQLDAVNRSFTLSNDSLSENLYTSAEREKINCFAGNDDLILDSEQLDYSKDILQPQHYSGLSQPTLEDSLVSSLAANFDAALVLNTTTADNTQRNTLSLPIDPESSSSHASSDNETYVECRSFSSGIGDPLHGWEDLVTSVTEMNMDSLENINEQLDSQLDMTPTEATASEFLNLPIEIIESVVPAIEEQMMQMLVTSKDGNIHTEQKVIKGEEISNLDVTTCIKLEAVDLKVASVIENVDTNSCDHEVNDEEKVSEMPVGPSVDDHPINDLNLTTPIDGHHTGELNCTIPVENHPTEDLNRTTPIDGHHTGELNCTIPVDDHPTEDLNQTTPVDGYPTAELNCTKPVDDHLTEDLNQNTPVNGRPIGDFNCSIPVDKYPANNASVNDHPKEDSNSLTPVDDLPKEDLNRTTTTCDEREYCNNVTVEADKLFAAHNKSVSDNNASFNAADTNQGSNLDECIVLTCATVEQIVEKLPTTICESALNVTQDVAHSPSPLQLDLRSASPSQLEGASYSPISPSSKFPIKPTHDNSLFPKSPTKCDPPPEFPTVPPTVEQNRSRSASPNSLQAKESKLNHTLDIVQTSPNGTTSQPNVKAAMDSLSNPMDSTFTANQEMLNATTTVEPAVFDQTFDGNMITEILPPNRKRSLSPSINNKTVNMDIHEGNNETRDYEPMDVDISSPNPNRTVSFPSLQSPVSNVSLEEKIKSNGVNPNDTMSFPTLPSTISNESLSEKEKCDAKDEKDVFVEKVASHDIGAIDDMFQSTKDLFHSSKAPSMGFPSHIGQPSDIAGDEDFQSNRLFLNPSDFDFLLTKGNNNVEVDRSSLLLRFDPLLGHSVPVNLPVKAGTSSLPSVFTSVDKQQAEFTLQNRLSPTNEEEEHFYDSNRSFQQQQEKRLNITQPRPTQRKTPEEYPNGDRKQQQEKQPLQVTTRSIKKNVKMSVDVMQDMKIENDCKSIEGIDTQTDEKHNFKMDELEKKIKNEVLKTEDIEKKLKEAEQREEALIKRITEKDKTIAKMNGVIEAYEKAIAELIAEKEQIIQNYEKQLTEVKTDRDSNYHHLTSLETTFSDLHVKYEKSKEMTAQLKSNEESLLAEKRQNLENLRLQEQRYEKMKNHAMQQLEIANKKLESLTKNHSVEITKLKALLKKEEISRASINEQLQQKSRENEELVKICDELINGQGS